MTRSPADISKELETKKRRLDNVRAQRQLKNKAQRKFSEGLAAIDKVDLHAVNSATGVNPIASRRALGATGRPEPISLQEKFRRACYNITGEEVVRSHIALPDGTCLAGVKTNGNRLFVRDCYPRLLELVLPVVNNPSPRAHRVVVLGTPGVGKTFFGFYLLVNLIRERQYDILYKRSNSALYLYPADPKSVAKTISLDESSTLNLEETIFICDGIKPPIEGMPTVLITSPQREIWWQFHKDGCRNLFMPVWTLDELLSCRILIFPDVDEHRVKHSFMKWGGVARHVLSNACNPHYDSSVWLP